MNKNIINRITVFLCAAVSVLLCSYVCTGDIQIRIGGICGHVTAIVMV